MADAPVDWVRAQDALRREVERTTELLRSVRNPSAHAVGQWSVVETAVHLSQAWLVVPSLAKADLSPVWEFFPGLEGTAGASLIREIWDLGSTTSLGVQTDVERDPSVLADRIQQRAAAYLDVCRHADGDELRPWLVEGSKLRLSSFTCHLLNETVVHGYDIARAEGRKWPIDPASAVLVLEGFILEVIRAIDARALVDQEEARSTHATYELRLRGGSRVLFVFDCGELHLEAPGSRRVDCVISAEPAAMLLVAWARRNQWSAIGRGQMLAWGRRPWLGLQFRSLLRNP